jgi:hypothetical protein
MTQNTEHGQCYYYIPLAHEEVLTKKIEWWSNTRNGWTIITPIYAPSENLVLGLSTVQNILKVDRVRQNFSFGFENPMRFDELQPQFMQLIGFTLSGDLDKFAPEVKAELMQLDGVVCIADSNEYREFLNRLK